MYRTIGRCQDCGKTERFLEFVDYVETPEGFQSIAVCAYGCNDQRSQAHPIEDMVNSLMEQEIKRLKREVRKATMLLDTKARVAAEADIHQRIERYEQVQKYNKLNRLNVDDWSRILTLANQYEQETNRTISQRQAMRQTAKCRADIERLQEEKRFHRELFRYAMGQCM